MMKRTVDIVGGVCGLLFIAPFTPLIAFAILLESGFPAFVKLGRVSEGHAIGVYKFRTMIAGAETMKSGLMDLNERKDGAFFKIEKDPRLTRVGTFLRKLRLDEFPQFWNVLKGDLSLVGPRPHEPEEIAQYPEVFKKIADAKAGLTGLSQVKGASALSFLKELEYDLYYLEHQSFVLDLKILFQTFLIFITDPTGV